MNRRKSYVPSQKKVAEKLAVMLGQQEAPSIDLKEFVREMTLAFGGPASVCRAFRDEWLEAPKGGMARQRIMEMYLRAITFVTTHEMDAPPDPSDLSKEDLQNFVRSSTFKLLQAEEEEEERHSVQAGQESVDFSIFDDIPEGDFLG